LDLVAADRFSLGFISIAEEQFCATMPKSIVIQLDEVLFNPRYTRLEKLIMESAQWRTYQRGEITQAEFVTTYPADLISISRAELIALTTAMIQYPEWNHHLMAKLTNLKVTMSDQVKIYSGADFPKEQWQAVRNEANLCVPFWSGHFISGNIGFLQSDPSFWIRVLAIMNQSKTPHDVLYIGRFEANISCAESFGINCILTGKPSGELIHSAIEALKSNVEDREE
jgi:hypothetical protein